MAFWDLLEWHEIAIACLLLTSTVATLPMIALSITTVVTFTASTELLIFSIFLSLLTGGCNIVAWSKWKRTAEGRKGTNKDQVIYMRNYRLRMLLLALAWLAVAIATMATASTLSLTKSYLRNKSKPAPHYVDLSYIWIQGLLGYFISGMMWATFGLANHYRRHSRKSQQPRNPTNKILSETHKKWLLGLILSSIVVSFLAFGLSFCDGALGGYSVWITPAAALLTGIAQWLTILTWRSTAKSRRGTFVPPSIYSTTFVVVTGFLSLSWLVATLISFLIASSKYDNRQLISWTTKYRSFKVLYYIRWVAAGFTVLAALLMSAQFWLVAIYHTRASKHVAHSRDSSNITAVEEGHTEPKKYSPTPTTNNTPTIANSPTINNTPTINNSPTINNTPTIINSPTFVTPTIIQTSPNHPEWGPNVHGSTEASFPFPSSIPLNRRATYHSQYAGQQTPPTYAAGDAGPIPPQRSNTFVEPGAQFNTPAGVTPDYDQR